MNTQFRLFKLDAAVILLLSWSTTGKMPQWVFVGPASYTWLDFVILIIIKWYVDESDLGEIAFLTMASIVMLYFGITYLHMRAI